jgi:hypothetical protein
MADAELLLLSLLVAALALASASSTSDVRIDCLDVDDESSLVAAAASRRTTSISVRSSSLCRLTIRSTEFDSNTSIATDASEVGIVALDNDVDDIAPPFCLIAVAIFADVVTINDRIIDNKKTNTVSQRRK